MLAWCGLFMQEVFDTQSQSFQKPLMPSNPSMLDTNANKTCTNSATQETDVDVMDLPFDNDLINLMEDETLLANNSNEELLGQKQTVDCHTHEQYFACKLLKFSTM